LRNSFLLGKEWLPFGLPEDSEGHPRCGTLYLSLCRVRGDVCLSRSLSSLLSSLPLPLFASVALFLSYCPYCLLLSLSLCRVRGDVCLSHSLSFPPLPLPRPRPYVSPIASMSLSRPLPLCPRRCMSLPWPYVSPIAHMYLHLPRPRKMYVSPVAPWRNIMRPNLDHSVSRETLYICVCMYVSKETLYMCICVYICVFFVYMCMCICVCIFFFQVWHTDSRPWRFYSDSPLHQ
jgi:hypothetical protein